MKNDEYQRMYVQEANHWWFVTKQHYIRYVLSTIQSKLPAQPEILDAGCGTGGLFGELSRVGSVTGIDPNRTAVALARRRGMRCSYGSVMKIPFPDKSFDITCCLDVLYHKGISEKRAFAELRRVLKPGGYLIITDCAGPWLYGPHDIAVEARKRFTLGELMSLAENGGFRILRASYYYFLTFPVFAIKRFLDRRKTGITDIHSDVSGVHPAMNAIMRFIMKIELLLFRYINFPSGSSVIVLAAKA